MFGDSFWIPFIAGLLFVLAVAAGALWLVRKYRLGIATACFIVLVIPWYMAGGWAGVLWSDYPSWWDQYFANSVQWYPLYVGLSVIAAVGGRIYKASKGYMRTIAIIPLLSWLPWTCVLWVYVIFFEV